MGDDPKCGKCGVAVTSSMMAFYCPRVEQCEFWPEDKPGQDFIRKLRDPKTWTHPTDESDPPQETKP